MDWSRGGIRLCRRRLVPAKHALHVPSPRARNESPALSEPIQRDLRLDHIPPDQIEAMEVYAGAAQTPAEFSATAMPGLEPGCTIVIWTR